jgi:hypothetical protein
VPTPGWYNDESDPALARWFDGVAWTDHVVDKAAWEAAGHEPPPPAELWTDEGPSRAGRVRLALGSAAVVLVLLVAGVALAQSGDGGSGDGTDQPASQRRSGSSDGTAATSEGLADLAGDPGTSLGTAGVADPGAGGAGGAGGSSGATGGSTRSTTRSTTKTANGVTRSESRTESHSNPVVQSNPTSGDKSSVGNTTDKTIKDSYTPPPPPPPSDDPPPNSTTPDSTPSDGGTDPGAPVP